MKKIEHIANLVNFMRAAIKDGDWVVEDSCDPDLYLSMAEARLEQDGWNDGAGFWQRDQRERSPV